VEKDLDASIAWFWKAISTGDKVDSALKDMAVVMKQRGYLTEAIDAIRSLRHLCPKQSQESLDNILLDLYKASGRTKEEIELLKQKLRKIYLGEAFHGKTTKRARSHGRKIHVSVKQETSRVLVRLDPRRLIVHSLPEVPVPVPVRAITYDSICLTLASFAAGHACRATSRGRICSSATSWRRRWCTGRRR